MAATTPRVTDSQPLSLHHAFGFRNDIKDCVFNLSDGQRNVCYLTP